MISKETRDKYLPTIGIECHVQLATKTKLFGGVDNDAREAEPNSKISAGDYALPGMLPYLNHEAVRLAARAGKALNSKIAKVSSFDRKHYFYPDLPRGYQLSQMFYPIILAGYVDLPNGERVRINHAHLEDDAGKLTHHGDYSLIDLNRAGTPLIEIVSEPDMHSAADAKSYAQELWQLMTYAGVTFGNLYYGNMRFDVNVSVAPVGAKKLGTRIEVKNINSFKMVERAAEHEIDRQIEMIEKGEKFVQATRGWDDVKGKTVPQRDKENAQDYRYMPDPDVPPIVLTEADIAEMQKDMPMLPPEYRAKFAALGVDDSVINAVLADQNIAKKLAQILENSDVDTARRVANWFASAMVIASDSEAIQSDNLDRHGDKSPRDDKQKLPSTKNLIKLSQMTGENKLSSTAAKEVFTEMLNKDIDPEKIAEAKNLLQVSDTNEIEKIVDEVLADPAAAQAVADIKNGELKAIGFVIGLVMKKSQGKANPSIVNKIIKEKLQ
ncbi:Asp-tRNA(Asn)/Glu-tRNA(Gln) amidotransferase subunit GatB [Candidatus Saccharibacteria bacterium]|nr:Asp-tRNA(Asn)/Glu-tRNA(Gln) amidotransferase subunit GatB [Candidatus Saccharibacteria bacterium]